MEIPPNPFQKLRALWRKEQFSAALAYVESLLGANRDCPYLWTARGDLIQLAEPEPADRLPLKEAARAYQQALKLNPTDLEALESLAHFYDAVDPKPRLALRYARRYMELSKDRLDAVVRIVNEAANAES